MVRPRVGGRVVVVVRHVERVWRGTVGKPGLAQNVSDPVVAGARLTRSRPRQEFTRDEDRLLVKYLAKYTPTGAGRRGNRVFSTLEENVGVFRLGVRHLTRYAPSQTAGGPGLPHIHGNHGAITM